jgi:heat shock protein HslJ
MAAGSTAAVGCNRFLAAGAVVLTAACTTVAVDARALAGTKWQVAALNGRPVPQSDRFRMSFERSAFSMRFGCNSGGGAYRLAGTSIVPGPVRATQMACASPTDDQPDPMAVEHWGFEVAGQPMRMQWNGATRLRLRNAAGTIDLKRIR